MSASEEGVPSTSDISRQLRLAQERVKELEYDKRVLLEQLKDQRSINEQTKAEVSALRSLFLVHNFEEKAETEAAATLQPLLSFDFQSVISSLQENKPPGNKYPRKSDPNLRENSTLRISDLSTVLEKVVVMTFQTWLVHDLSL